MGDPVGTVSAEAWAHEPWLSRWDDPAKQRRWPLRGVVLTIGRARSADVVVEDDPLVSRLHARLEQVGERWTIVDDGLSRNGTYVCGHRVTGRVVLHDRDQIRVGGTTLTFCAPGEVDEAHTLVGEPLVTSAQLTPAQRAVVTALCRPCLAAAGPSADGFLLPATNAQIAEELCLSIDAVKTHLRDVAHKLGLDGLPQNEKRVRTAHLAMRLGLVGGR